MLSVLACGKDFGGWGWGRGGWGDTVAVPSRSGFPLVFATLGTTMPVAVPRCKLGQTEMRVRGFTRHPSGSRKVPDVVVVAEVLPFTSTETVGLLVTPGAQDGHLDFHYIS